MTFCSFNRDLLKCQQALCLFFFFFDCVLSKYRRLLSVLHFKTISCSRATVYFYSRYQRGRGEAKRARFKIEQYCLGRCWAGRFRLWLA